MDVNRIIHLCGAIVFLAMISCTERYTQADLGESLAGTTITITDPTEKSVTFLYNAPSKRNSLGVVAGFHQNKLIYQTDIYRGEWRTNGGRYVFLAKDPARLRRELIFPNFDSRYSSFRPGKVSVSFMNRPSEIQVQSGDLLGLTAIANDPNAPQPSIMDWLKSARGGLWH